MIVYCYDKKPSAEIGGKGEGLFKLLGYGLKVPEFFVITADADIHDRGFRDELNAYADMLDCDMFAVRSSGIAEDGSNASYAGQFKTELYVKKEKLLDAVMSVAESFCTSGAASYGERFGQNDNCGMAIIVQRQIVGQESGVMFSTSPHSADEVLIESVRGCGESLVGGKVTPVKRSFKKTLCNEEGYVRELTRAAELLERGEKTAVDVEWTYDGKSLWFLQLRPQTALSDKLPSGLDKKDWKLYVRRDFTVFNHSVQETASAPAIQKKVYGFGIPIYEGLIVCGREFYTKRNDELCCRDWARLDNGNFFDDFIARIDKRLALTSRRTSALMRRDFSNLSDKALIKTYKKEIERYIESYIPMMIRPDDYLFGELIKAVGESEARNIANALSPFTKKTLYSEERREFLLAVIYGRNREYLKKYEWMTSPLGVNCSTFTEADFAARAKEFNCERARKALGELNARQRAERINASRYLREAVDCDIAKLCGYILRFMYFRTRTAELSDRYFYYIRKILLAEICARFNFDERDLLALRYDEVEQYVTDPKAFTNVIRKHKSGEAIVFENGDSRAYYGAYSYDLLKKILSAAEIPTGNFVRGEIACAGEVTARVTVINGADDISKMERGCILVTSMTTPELVVALDKAVGIITDEGGITCHAAILAREYGVPCLVSTQSATRLLKDGTIVRLDCVNGGFEIEP